MTDRPILFSKPMILALLAGRKTQTRRIIKPQPEQFKMTNGEMSHVYLTHIEGDDVPRITLGTGKTRVITTQEIRCAVGDRLWVREDFCFDAGLDGEPPHCFPECTPIRYLADGATTEPPPAWPPFETAGRRRASMHMPRRFSRITLDVTEVRVERLQDISKTDAIAEGIQQQRTTGWFSVPGVNGAGTSAVSAYAMLWNDINGAGAWNANPWIAAYSFRVHLCNIDRMEA